MKVKLVGITAAINPEDATIKIDIPGLMSYAARTCYEGEEPTGDKLINIADNIFPVGHHTVIQHTNFTFFIEGIPIGAITLALHLYMMFYVSSQRSGRFCFGMFSDPQKIDDILQQIRKFYPETTEVQLNQILTYLKHCLRIFHENLEAGTKFATDFIRAERPQATDKYIEQNAKKFAQEQLRVLVPVIFPTADVFTIDLSALAALYRVAWDPVTLDFTAQMVKEVLAVEPTLAYAFQRQTIPLDATPKLIIPASEKIDYRLRPSVILRSMDNLSSAVYPTFDDLHPVDTLYFAPKFMSNNDIYIKTQVYISLATTGQDQRHRRINRGPVNFTGYIYCPPIAHILGLGPTLADIGNEWIDLSQKLHPALAQTLAPYGAMVTYTKAGDLNATMHEQEKRTCWCTQEEIYEISRQLREAISRHPHCTSELLNQLSPPCFKCGTCGEGRRYCGRDLTVDHADFFPQRKV